MSRVWPKQQRRSHGVADSGTWTSWSNMMNRCNNPKTPAYAKYGARGITVCERWLVFANFLADMGERPAGTSIDRIDNDKGYSPDNCRWGTRAQQSENRSTTKFVEHMGERLCLSEWARRAGIHSATLGGRLAKGWTLEMAMATPVAKRGKGAR